MFRFTHGSNEFKVSFSYSEKLVRLLQKDGLLSNRKNKLKQDERRRIVTAVIFRQTPEGFKRVSVGISACSPKDQFEYDKGRKIALGRAVKNSRAETSYNVINEPTSVSMWSAYFTQHKPGDKKISPAFSFEKSQKKLQLRRQRRFGTGKSTQIASSKKVAGNCGLHPVKGI